MRNKTEFKFNKKDVHYLAFEGGGGKGIAFLGAVQALSEKKILPIKQKSKILVIKGKHMGKQGEIVKIEDENGINTTESSGHEIMFILDNSQPVDITQDFVYDLNEFTKGQINYQLFNLTEGHHIIKVIAFDNFNQPAVGQSDFFTRSSNVTSIENMLPYPNPMSSGGYFTFLLTESANVNISIYTITGRKIRTISVGNLNSGYNQVFWNGKDGDGDPIANGTYFYKIKADSEEKIGKVIILK